MFLIPFDVTNRLILFRMSNVGSYELDCLIWWKTKNLFEQSACRDTAKPSQK